MLPDYIFENDVLFFVACLAKKIFLNLIFFFFCSCKGNWFVSLQSVFAQGKKKKPQTCL